MTAARHSRPQFITSLQMFMVAVPVIDPQGGLLLPNRSSSAAGAAPDPAVEHVPAVQAPYSEGALRRFAGKRLDGDRPPADSAGPIRLLSLASANVAKRDDKRDEGRDDARRKRRARYLRKLFLLSRPRGAGHPAAVDGRYRRVFPMRAQDNRLHVCTELADPLDGTRVDPDIRLLSVALHDDDIDRIRCDIAAGLFPGRKDVRDLDEQERACVDERCAALAADLLDALNRTARGEEPVPVDEVYVRTLADEDLGPGESALKGQYGLFNRRSADGAWRTVERGLHLCLFGGVYCASAQEYEAECERYPADEINAYALVIGDGDYPCISPYQGGDLGQFANTALARDARGRIVEDKDRTNTRFARATAVFEDGRPEHGGRRIVHTIAFLYMLAATAENSEPEREARVWYGGRYWES
jgi:hypothetical protein